MKNIHSYDEFLNEDGEKHFAFGEVRGDEIRINAVKNKMF